MDYDELAKIVDMDAVKADLRDNALNPEHPVSQRYCTEPGHITSRAREACNTYYENIPDRCLRKIYGRNKQTYRP